MMEQYYKIIEFLKKQKNIIINSSKNRKEDINVLKYVNDQILDIDNKLKSEYKLKLNKKTKDNNFFYKINEKLNGNKITILEKNNQSNKKIS